MEAGSAATSIAEVFSIVSSGITTMLAQPLVAIALAIPVTKGIVKLARSLFKRA